MTEHTPKWFARQRRDGSWYAGLASVGWNLADTCAADFPGKDGKARCEMAVAAVNRHAALKAAFRDALEIAEDMGGKTPAQRCALIAETLRRALEEA